MLSVVDGEAAVTLKARDLEFTCLPCFGMLGVSLRHRGDELLALPRSIAGFRDGKVTGLPLLHPYANRLSEWRYRIGPTTVDLQGQDIPTDPSGLPIHGFLRARPFEVTRLEPTRCIAELDLTRDAEFAHDFPFPQRLRVDIRVAPQTLTVATVLIPTGRRAVPVSFGWHPFLTLPGTPRSQWQLRLPPCDRHVLDNQLIPTGSTTRQPRDTSPIGRRTYDDHFALGRDRRFAISDKRRTLEIAFDRGYAHAQIYLPGPDAALTGDFICIEPMTAPTNALVDRSAPMCASVDTYRAVFTITVS
ncbi:MAG TPA: aldose 1-epimerase [Acidimicrobiia bacterium]|jgi:galactose mutarotase-like enzyme